MLLSKGTSTADRIILFHIRCVSSPSTSCLVTNASMGYDLINWKRLQRTCYQMIDLMACDLSARNLCLNVRKVNTFSKH